jgi:hypothetical protein
MAKPGLSIKRKRTLLIPVILQRFFQESHFSGEEGLGRDVFRGDASSTGYVTMQHLFRYWGVVVSGNSISRRCLNKKIEV